MLYFDIFQIHFPPDMLSIPIEGTFLKEEMRNDYLVVPPVVALESGDDVIRETS
jgi:hypothetical protein